MLSIHLIKLGNEEYYLDMLKYYLSQGKAPTWIGGLADVFRLKDKPVEEEQFKRLLRGQHPSANLSPAEDSAEPTPIPLVQNAGVPSRQAAWDHTFSAPKSLSIIWATANAETAQGIEAIHQQAVEQTMAFAEENFAYSRKGKEGAEIVRAKIIAAPFQDFVSRAGDPQLHTHTLVFNAGLCEDGHYRSIVSRPFYRNKMLLGAYYRAAEAHMLFQTYGFKTERVGNCYEIQGVPKDLVDYCSKRRKQLLAVMAELGVEGAKAAEKAALASRSSKTKLPPLKDLKEKWPEEYKQLFGFDEQAVEALHTESADTKHLVPEVLARAAKNIVASQHHFTAHDFLREALYEAAALAVAPEDVIPEVKSYIEQSPEIISIPSPYGEQRYTTKEVLQQELSVLGSCRVLYEKEGAVVSGQLVEEAIETAQQEAQAHGYSLSEEQVAAIRHLTQDKHSIRILQGYAGVGKTTAVLKPTVKAFKAAGYTVLGAAYTGIAAQQLAASTGIECDTLHSLLGDFETDHIHEAKRYAKHTIRQVGRAARRKPTWKYKGRPKSVEFGPNTVLIVDEASMVGCRQSEILLGKIMRAGATVIFTGDHAQLGAIEGTSPFYSLTQRIPYAKLINIQRQEDAWAREAAQLFAAGNVAAALKLYDDRALLKTSEDEEAAMQALLDQWEHHALERPKEARILTCTNDQAHELNLLAQQRRLDEAPASGIRSPNRSLKITDADDNKTYTSEAYVGDRIMFTKNARRYSVWNGDVGTVIAFDGGHLVVELDRGITVSVPVIGHKAYRNVRLGYATTTHKAQGATFPIVFTLLSGSMMNLPSSYVQGTRSTKATHFFTTKQFYGQLEELEESLLVSQMGRSTDLSLATDFFVSPSCTEESPEQLRERVITDWQRTMNPESTLIVTSTEEEARLINERCHELHLAAAQEDWKRKQLIARRKRIATERRKLDAQVIERRTADAQLSDAEQPPSIKPFYPHDSEIPHVIASSIKLVGGERICFPKGMPLSLGAVVPNSSGLVTSVDPYTDCIEVKFDGSETSKRIAVENVPEIETEYALMYMILKRRRERRKLEELKLVNPQNFEKTQRPDAQGAPDYFRQHPYQCDSPTIFNNPCQAQSDLIGLSQIKYTTTTVYQQTDHNYQQQAAWHHQVQQANQSTHWSVQQAQYLNQIGHSNTQSQYESRQF
ncbi:MAG: hypothetical protein CMJ58_28450 [Planctomycetaceae bacterium]|nr:hypothetical protein [Planctomycetaceae bacterium]